jgi:cystathionine beta-lyase family protein involved in aluminum resistance
MFETKLDIEKIITEAQEELQVTQWRVFDEIKDFNQEKVLNAFIESGIQNSHYTWVTGYGYDDLGKEKLDELYARCFNTEAALVRPQLVSGTHAISCGVFGNLNAGDSFVAVGKPYDTLATVFKKMTQRMKLNYDELSEFEPEFLDTLSAVELIELLKSKISKNTKLVFLQRSRGYEWRDSYSLTQLERIIIAVKKINPELIVFTDNCYGEFTQKQEPTDIGADLIAGSLIKNPGAGIVAAGAYIAGKKAYVINAAEQLTAPGIAEHGGCMFDQTRIMMQGLFLAPLIVSEALKGMSLAARVFEQVGLETIPASNAERNDIIQAIKFASRDKLIKFCHRVQAACPVNSMFSPVPSPISGYDDEVIMASGSFIEGSSIELSADGPIREPYIGYFQGGLSYSHTKLVIKSILGSGLSIQHF